MIEQEYFTVTERLANSRAVIEQHRLREMSRGMIQQVYNDNTYRMEIWGHLGYVCGFIMTGSMDLRNDAVISADLGAFLSWQYKENTVRFIVSNPALRHHGDYATIDLIEDTLMFSDNMAHSRRVSHDNPDHN